MSRAWYSAAELAELALPGLPKVKRKVNELASEGGWAFAVDRAGEPLARKRAGRGGGFEYHRSLLPPASVLELMRRGLAEPEPAASPAPAPMAAAPCRDQAWAWFESRSEADRNEARARLETIQAVEALEAAGLTRTAAIASVAGQRDVSAATLWGWLKLCAGLRADDRLPALAPRRRGGGAEAEIDARAWQAFKSDYLRPEKPTWAACYGRLERMAADRGWGALPHVKTFQRKLERELDPRAITLAREGVDELRRRLPPQSRTVAELHALQHVNIDGHKWDVFCRWPDGRISRPMMVAIQDLYSRKMLAWRIGESESAQDVRLAYADLFKRYGVPDACTLDNGRAFASKWITGGTPNRYRFKVKDSDPLGLLTQFGVRIHWALPYRGQSKPIERAFRTLEGRIATHPALSGAYVGNKPDAKPDNYGSRAVPIEEFKALLAEEIAVENARRGRDTEMARGVLSFDEVFQASYAASPIRRATPEQLRLALLAAEAVSTDRSSGAVTLFGNRYWSEDLLAIAGQRVIVHFDPDDLHGEVHLYDLSGRFLATAPVWEKVGFIDVDAARVRARLESDHRRKARAALQAENLLSAAELAELMPAPSAEPEPLAPTIIRPVRRRGSAAAALQVESPSKPARTSILDRLADGFERPASAHPHLRLVETKTDAALATPRPDQPA